MKEVSLSSNCDESWLPISGMFFSSHGNALVLLREDEIYEIYLLSASEDPSILGKSLVVKTFLSSSLGLEIIWPVRKYLLNNPLAPIIKWVMGVAAGEKIGLANVARIYSQLCNFCQPHWYQGAAYFSSLAALDMTSQEYLAINPQILPTAEKMVAGMGPDGADLISLPELKLRINPEKSHYFLALACKLLQLLKEGNVRAAALFGLASFRKRFTLVTGLSVASLYEKSWEECSLSVPTLTVFLQLINRSLQPLYQSQGPEVVSSLAVESIFTGIPSTLTELVLQLPLPPGLLQPLSWECPPGSINRHCRLCRVGFSSSDARLACWCGGQIR